MQMHLFAFFCIAFFFSLNLHPPPLAPLQWVSPPVVRAAVVRAPMPPLCPCACLFVA